jgi:hypothetical protein
MQVLLLAPEPGIAVVNVSALLTLGALAARRRRRLA